METKIKYKDELIRAMHLLADDPRTIFLGQGAEYSGSPMYEAVKDIPAKKRMEMPVAEDMQMGISIGLALKGYIPVSMYPRMDFLICAMNQLVNHLDKIEEMTNGQYKPKVIIRTAIGATNPLYPGAQHCQDHSFIIRNALNNIHVYNILRKEEIVTLYKNALNADRSTIIIEEAQKMRE